GCHRLRRHARARGHRRVRCAAATPSMNPAPPAADNPMRQAMRLQQDGRYTEAEALYRQILSANPRYAPALSFLGMIEAHAGRAEGLERLAEAVKLEAGLSVLWLNYGLGLQQCRQLAEAESALRRAIALEDGLYEAHLALARLLYRCGRFEDAALGYRKV